ncbi:hypothetical protein T484DRAFT_1861418 [Baffinella frigidus]|nr:hypothetical protein T484DRAFT_1861418 [Cryptophyta sp. CCMP2293]
MGYLEWKGMHVLCFATMLLAIITSFAPPPVGVNTWGENSVCATGDNFEAMDGVCICPRETVCAKNWRSVLFLTLARCSAYFDYPLYVCLFLTKAHNLRAFLSRSYLSVFLKLDHPHEVLFAITSEG